MKARPLSGNGKPPRFTEYVGFFTEAGRSTDLDAAMQQAGMEKIEAQHPRDSGDPIIKTHWNLGETLRFFPVTQGPPATSARLCLGPRLYQRTVDGGIGLRWPNGENAQMGVIGYLEPLIQVGYIEPIKLATRSLMVDYLLKALADHVRVAKFADSIVDREKHPDVVELYELAWVIGAGEQVTFGKDKTSLVTPMVSQHPHTLTKEHVRSIYLKDDDLGQAVREKALLDWEAIQEWAKAFAQGTGDQFNDDKQAATLEGTAYGLEASEKALRFQLNTGSETVPCVAFGKVRQDLLQAGLHENATIALRGRYESNPQWGDQANLDLAVARWVFQQAGFSIALRDLKLMLYWQWL